MLQTARWIPYSLKLIICFWLECDQFEDRAGFLTAIFLVQMKYLLAGSLKQNKTFKLFFLVLVEAKEACEPEVCRTSFYANWLRYFAILQKGLKEPVLASPQCTRKNNSKIECHCWKYLFSP